MIIRYLISAVLGYLLGSISFAILITKGFLKKDVRTMGSGNAGATNVARVFGFGIGAATFVGDVLKTVVSMKIGEYLGGETGMVLAAAGCFIGHSWPIYYHFKGGKGVSVGAAIGFMLDVRLFIALVIIFFIVALSTKIVSLASITVAAAFPVILLLLGGKSLEVIVLGFFLGATVIYLHRSNIKRLLKGEEPKFKAKSARNTSNKDYGGKR